MSVLPCNRHGCENIMCDRHSIEYGYICDECFEELVALKKAMPHATTDEFMDSPKQSSTSDADARGWLDAVFIRQS